MKQFRLSDNRAQKTVSITIQKHKEQLERKVESENQSNASPSLAESQKHQSGIQDQQPT
uniref:Uncharacterized protein n=1 Tax=Oryza brachyantha TaxID=4533 RepID=J3LKC6_ORYBR